MPIYEYKCDKCTHEFELLRRVSDNSEVTCPECQAIDITKLVSAPKFKLKGTGWYETDFKDKKTDKKSSGDKGADNSNDKKTSSAVKKETKTTKDT